jgi:NAD(P)H-hydrate epimerase
METIGPDALPAWLPPRPRACHAGASAQVSCDRAAQCPRPEDVLCAQAALHAGAGLASVATRAAHVPALLARQPEAMAHAIESADALAPLFARASVIAIGPGLGQDAWGRAMIGAELDEAKPLVLDADALNLFASAPRALPAGTILTPHPGEAARLLGTDVSAVQSDRNAAALALVQRHGVVVVLKGAGTLVAAPGRVPRIVAAGNPGMATGGMGDLLTGVIAALRAQGLPGFDAASCGALLHAHAGDVAARDGERGLLPGDLLGCLRRCANPRDARA